MSRGGRGRGYAGRHQLREQRPGNDLDLEGAAARTLAKLNPRSSGPTTLIVKVTVDSETESVAEKPEKSEGQDEITFKEMLRVDDQYVPLVTLLEQFCPEEEGVQFNRKLRHFEATIANMCPDETRLHQAFATFRAAALHSSATARKLAAVGATFSGQPQQQQLRSALLNIVMQITFSKLEDLEKSNPLFLINAANLMGDYFAKARLNNGNKVHILASPLLQYMRALLATNDIRAHRSLATQLMQNGRELLSLLAQELDELSISIRLRLLSPPPISPIWLLLSADLCLNKFLMFPTLLQQFYASHLELTAEENYSDLSYDSWKNSPEKEEVRGVATGYSTENVGYDTSQNSLNNNDDSKPKLRPILGAGAAMLRQEQASSVNQENFDTWTPKNRQRYDLNSWRQEEQDKKRHETEYYETVFLPNFVVPDYPPPLNTVSYQETFVNYQIQTGEVYTNPFTNPEINSEGDGAYYAHFYESTTQNIQQIDGANPFSNMYNIEGDSFPQFLSESSEPVTTEDHPPSSLEVRTERTGPQMPESVNKEIQESNSERPVENWREKKKEVDWAQQASYDQYDNYSTEVDLPRNSRDSRQGRMNRRNSGEEGSTNNSFKKTSSRRLVTEVPRRQMTEEVPKRHVTEVPRRHVTEVPRRHVTEVFKRHVSEVPRSTKYWDHDDRCDKE